MTFSWIWKHGILPLIAIISIVLLIIDYDNIIRIFNFFFFINIMCCNPILEKWKDDSLTPKMGTWESAGTSETLELDCRGQNNSYRGVLYIIGKLSKFRCRKWTRMNDLDICNTSYDEKKGQESNWQFDSRPLKVRNRPDPSVCRWSVTHHWNALDEGYNISLDLITIEGL